MKGPTTCNHTTKPPVLVTAASGLLESHIVRELEKCSFPVNILSKNVKIAPKLAVRQSEVIEVVITLPKTLEGKLEGVHTIISTFGFRKKEKGLFDRVMDYRKNINLLQEAKQAGVRKFIYLAPLASPLDKNTKVIEARNNFILQLKESGIDYTIVRVNGILSDSTQDVHLPHRRKLPFFGKEKHQIKPVHSKDLAAICVEAVNITFPKVCIVEPEFMILKNELQMPLHGHSKTTQIAQLPKYLKGLISRAMGGFNSSNSYISSNFIPEIIKEDDIVKKYRN